MLFYLIITFYGNFSVILPGTYEAVACETAGRNAQKTGGSVQGFTCVWNGVNAK